MRYILYIISITIITMLLVIIGYFKEKTLPIELTNRLYKKAADKLVKYLNENNEATLSEVKKCIKGVTASVVWSRKRLAIQDITQFAENLVNSLCQKGILSEEIKGSKRIFTLTAKK